jgi:hypothetical protein
MRTCIYCKLAKNESNFSKKKNINGTSTIYYHSVCHKCAVIKGKEWRLKNLERYRSYQKFYQKEHRKKLCV